jgi:hypothetical protein
MTPCDKRHTPDASDTNRSTIIVMSSYYIHTNPIVIYPDASSLGHDVDRDLAALLESLELIMHNAEQPAAVRGAALTAFLALDHVLPAVIEALEAGR